MDATVILLMMMMMMMMIISEVVSSCCYQIRKIGQVRRLVRRDVTRQLLPAVVLAALDYCNSLLSGWLTFVHCPSTSLQDGARFWTFPKAAPYTKYHCIVVCCIYALTRCRHHVVCLIPSH